MLLKSPTEKGENDLTGYDISENIIYLMFSLSVNVGIMFIRHTYTNRRNHKILSDTLFRQSLERVKVWFVVN